MVARYQVPPAAGVIVGTDGNDVYNGAADLSFAQFDAGLRGSTIVNGATTPTSITSAAGTDTLNGITQLIFVDGRMVYNAEDNAGSVTRLYDIALDRAGDQGGFNYFIDQLDQGNSLASVADSLINSGEFSARFGAGLTNEQFVQVLYNNLRGEDATAGEVSYWADQVNNGSATLGDIVVAFANSQEAVNANAATMAAGVWDRDEGAIAVANLYDTAFNRLADLDGMAHWVNQLHTTDTSVGDIATAFYNSAEGQNAFGALGDADYINAIYQNALNRQADSGGMTFWMNELANGADRADIMLSISNSAEHQALTADLVQSDNPLNYGVSLVA
jgi:hypothetical protein